LPFSADASDHHAAALWLREGNWTAAREAVERIEAWRRIPAPLAWMAEVRYRSTVRAVSPVWRGFRRGC
jgi:hypothetical protein